MAPSRKIKSYTKFMRESIVCGENRAVVEGSVALEDAVLKGKAYGPIIL